MLVDGAQVAAVARGPAAVRRLAAQSGTEPIDLGEGLLAPGLVDAHAHLDLTALAGRVARDAGFGGWVAGLLEARAAAPPAELARGVARGAGRLTATGCVLVGDVDSTGAGESVLAGHPLRARLYREVLDAGDPERTPSALAAARQPYRECDGLEGGLSPHAPFSVSPALFGGLAELARAFAIHWSESEAEVEWLARGTGPLAGLLGPSPRRAGLDLIADAGLLGPRTALVHGNHPARGEPERIARAGATLVHCPGTHRFFERPPFPLDRYRSAGVRLALGTDSLASNEDLDMRREMALVREAHPGLDPQEVWSMATVGGAHALGYGTRTGRLAPGLRADCALFLSDGADRRGHLETLTAGRPEIAGTWIGGERVEPAAGGAGLPTDR